jgi:competence protein ComEC
MGWGGQAGGSRLEQDVGQGVEQGVGLAVGQVVRQAVGQAVGQAAVSDVGGRPVHTARAGAREAQRSHASVPPGAHLGAHLGAPNRAVSSFDPSWLWWALPLAVLLGLAAGLLPDRRWPVAWAACGLGGGLGLGGVALAMSRRQTRGVVAVGLGLLMAMVLAWSWTTWRAHLKAQAMWPAELGVRHACALVRLDSLPQALPMGGWQVDAEVARWVAVRGSACGQQAVADDAMQPGPPAHAASAAQTANVRTARTRARARSAPLPSAAELDRLHSIGRVRLYWSDDTLPEPGQAWWVQGRWHRPDGVANPGGPDAVLLAWERGTGAVGQVDARSARRHAQADGGALGLAGIWDRWRGAIRAEIAHRVPSPTQAGVLAGLTVGDQGAVSPEDWTVFRRTGVAHLMSISGSHIAVVGWWVAWLCRRHWGRSHRLAHLCPAPLAAMGLACLVCTGYALLSGWGLPAQRTVWTMLGLALLRLTGRCWSWPMSSLWVMGWVGMIDPWALMQAGFWLSFLCVVVLMMVGDAPSMVSSEATAALAPSGRVGGVATAVWQGLRSLLRAQLVLSVAMAPVAVWCFHQVSLAGVLVNLVAVPFFDLLLTPLALLGMVFSPLWTLAAWLIDGLMAGLRWASTWSWAVWALPEPPWWLGAWGLLAGLMWAWPGPRGWRWGWALALCPMLLLPDAWRLWPRPAIGQFQALAIDVGQGTAVLVRTRDHALLFDTGPRLGETLDAGSRHILPVLQAMGVGKLDALMISHEDNDHVGGALSVLQGVSVVQLVSSLQPDHPVRQWRRDAAASRLPHAPCQAGLSWDWDGVHFQVIHPFQADAPGAPASEPNAHSCVLKVSAAASPGMPDQSLLLTADIETEQETALWQQARRDPALQAALRATVLMAPHHGSSTSSTAGFLKAVQPRQIVVQAGQRNRYGHPAPSVIARYEAAALPWVATPTCGAWWWSTDEPMATARPAAPTAPAARALGPRPAVGHCWRTDHPRPWSG